MDSKTTNPYSIKVLALCTTLAATSLLSACGGAEATVDKDKKELFISAKVAKALNLKPDSLAQVN